MDKEVHYHVSQKQLSRDVTISKLIEKRMSIKEVDISMGLSHRYIPHLKRRVIEFGRVHSFIKILAVDYITRFKIIKIRSVVWNFILSV